MSWQQSQACIQRCMEIPWHLLRSTQQVNKAGRCSAGPARGCGPRAERGRLVPFLFENCFEPESENLITMYSTTPSACCPSWSHRKSLDLPIADSPDP